MTSYLEKPSTPGELMHFGVKGMKWGVRKDSRLRPSNWMTANKIESIGWDRMVAAEKKLNRHTNYDSPAYKKDKANYDKVKAEVMAERAAAKAKQGQDKRTAKAEKKWEKKATGRDAFIDTHNAAAQRMNDREIARINNKPEYKGKDFTQDSPLRRKYYKEYEDTFNRIMIEEHRKLFGTSPSGAKKLGIVDGQLQLVDVKHAMDDYDVKIEYDSNGYIRSIKIVETSLAQSELAHFGVKGMHWGVRKDKKPALAPHGSITKQQHQYNRATFGRRGANRINEKLHEGKDLKTARRETRAEHRKRRQKQVMIALGLYAAVQLAPLVLGAANTKLSNVAASKMAANGAKAAQNAFADSRGIANYKTIEATFDAATGLWG